MSASQATVHRPPSTDRFRRRHDPPRLGFTLIEIMIVVAIMAIVMAMSVPMVYKMWHKAPMIKAVKDVVAVCSSARAQAIMHGTEVDLVFHPQDKTFEVNGAAAAPAPAIGELPSVEPIEPPANSGSSGRLDDSIQIEMLDVNLTEYKDLDVVRVRFFPNGTCDEMTLIISSSKPEFYKITLEITTALATVGPVDSR